MSQSLAAVISDVLEDIRRGVPVIVVDELDRENEGDLVIAAEKASTENLAFVARHARGIMCLPAAGHILDRLEVPAMVEYSTDRLKTPFTVSIDAAHGVSTGVPVSDRLKTIDVLLDPASKPSDLARPGHLFPLRPHPEGLRGRRGHTESSVELMRLAGLKPVAVISEIMNEDGTMARGDSLSDFQKRWGLKIITIPQIIEHIEAEAKLERKNYTALILTAGNAREDIVQLSGTNCSAMIPANGKPAIYWNMTYLMGLGIRRFVIVSRPDHKLLKTYTEALFGSVAEISFVHGSPAGGPGDSLLTGLRYVETPGVLIVLGDTNFRFHDYEEETIQELEDFALVDDVSDHERWCMAEISHDSVIQKFHDKEPDRKANSQALIGVYKASDAQDLARALESAARRNSVDRIPTEISEGLAAYGESHTLRAIASREWLDLGNPDNLIGSRKRSLILRAYNSFSFDDLLGTITKRSENAKLADEIAYFKKLPTEISVLFPRLIASRSRESDGRTAYEMTLEYYGYPNLGDLILYGSLDANIWRRIISRLREILNLLSRTETSPGQPEYSGDIYIGKTEREFQALTEQSETFRALTHAETLSLNGEVYRNFPLIWPAIRDFVEDSLVPYASSVIHGDCCLANILYDTNSDNLRFVDPRGSFGEKGITGDIRYDVAKLYHSFEGGYEFLINDMFEVKKLEDGAYRLRLINEEAKRNPQRIFEEVFFAEFDKREIKTVQGLLYVSMCARHYDSQERQLAMYLTGVRLLNESLKVEAKTRSLNVTRKD